MKKEGSKNEGLKRPQNIHDKYFKEAFGDLNVAKDFLTHYLPASVIERINLQSLEAQKDSFVDESLRETFSDFLFKANIGQEEGYLYILMEHKSYSAPEIALQLLKYMINIWDMTLKNKPNKEKSKKNNAAVLLLPIIPLVIYHDKHPWRIPVELSGLIAGYADLPEEIRSYIPNYRYQIYDLSCYSNEELKGTIILKTILMALRDAKTADRQVMVQTVIKIIDHFSGLQDRRALDYLTAALNYIWQASNKLKEEDLETVEKQLATTYPEGSAVIMSLAEIYEAKGWEKGKAEGWEKGKAEGKAEGERKEKLEVAQKALQEGMDIALIAKITGLTKSEIEKLAGDLASSRSQNQQ